MKLNEIKQIPPLQGHGIPIDDFEHRELAFIENGFEVYKRVHKQNNNVWLFDIDDKAYLSGTYGEEFKGVIKTRAFHITRGWVHPDSRKQGMMLTMMVGVFEKLNCAIVSDREMTDDGKHGWERFLNVISYTNLYQVDVENNTVTKIDKLNPQEMFDNNYQYIVEKLTSSRNQTELEESVFKLIQTSPGVCKRMYGFDNID